MEEFPVIFHEELPRLQPKTEVEVTIEVTTDVAPETTPISKAQYWMSPSKLKELSNIKYVTQVTL